MLRQVLGVYEDHVTYKTAKSLKDRGVQEHQRLDYKK